MIVVPDYFLKYSMPKSRGNRFDPAIIVPKLVMSHKNIPCFIWKNLQVEIIYRKTNFALQNEENMAL